MGDRSGSTMGPSFLRAGRPGVSHPVCGLFRVDCRSQEFYTDTLGSSSSRVSPGPLRGIPHSLLGYWFWWRSSYPTHLVFSVVPRLPNLSRVVDYFLLVAPLLKVANSWLEVVSY